MTDRLDEIFTQHSLSESTSLYMLRDVGVEHGRRLDSIIKMYRKSYMMYEMNYRENQATKELRMFIPIHQKSL